VPFALFGQTRVASASPASVEAVNGYWDIVRDANALRADVSSILGGPDSTKALAELAVRSEVLARQLTALSGVADGLNESSLSSARAAAQQAFAASLRVVESALSPKALKRFRDNRNNTRRKDAWGPMGRGIGAFRSITAGGDKTKKKLGLTRSSPTKAAPPSIGPDVILDGTGKYGSPDTLYLRSMMVQKYDPMTGVALPIIYGLAPLPQQYSAYTQRSGLKVISGSSYVGFTKLKKPAVPPPAPRELRGNHWVYKGATDTLYVEKGWSHPMWETPPQFETHQINDVEEVVEGKLHTPFRRGVPEQPPTVAPPYATISTVLPSIPSRPPSPPPLRPGYTVAVRR